MRGSLGSAGSSEAAPQQAPPPDVDRRDYLLAGVDVGALALELDQHVPLLVAHLLAGQRHLPRDGAAERTSPERAPRTG